MNDINWRTPNDYDTQIILDSYGMWSTAIVQNAEGHSFIIQLEDMVLVNGKLIVQNNSFSMDIVKFALI